jgi:hypothetical protein
MIGGFAVNLHGFARTTGDLDIWLKDDAKNRINLGMALEPYGYEKTSFEKIEFVPGGSNINIGSGVMLDIITLLPGLQNISFDEALEESNVADIHGVKIPFLNLSQLIKNKKATAGTKDLIDVIELEKIKKIKGE